MTGTQKSEIDLDRLPAILAAQARGEAIPPEHAELLRRAEQEDPELRGEARLWAALGRLGDARGDGIELSDAVMLERVLARAPVAPAPSSAAKPRASPRPMLRRGVSGTIAGVAVAATLVVALAAELIDGNEPPPPPPPAPSERDALLPSGRDALLPSARDALLPSARDALLPSARDALLPSGRDALLPSGRDALLPSGGPSLPAPAAPEEPSPGGGAGTAEAEPPPDVGAATNEPEAAGAEARERAPRPPRPRPQEAATSAQALLLRAQARLGEGKNTEATAAYRALLAQHPSSPEARAALVSLGQMSLHQGRAAEALAYFERYLAGGSGPLAAEARVGTVQCLRRLGRTAEERAAIADFLSRHGESVHAPRLRARLSELGGK